MKTIFSRNALFVLLFCSALTLAERVVEPSQSTAPNKAYANLTNQTNAESGQSSNQTEKIKFGFDGTLWNKTGQVESIGEVGKLILVRGIYDGLMFGRSPMMSQYYTNTSYEHLIRALDQFYGDYRNEKIPVVAALHIISMELKGASKDAIDLELRRTRNIFSK